MLVGRRDHFVLYGDFFDGVHVRRDQRGVRGDVTGFQAGAQACESLCGADEAAVSNVGVLGGSQYGFLEGRRRRIGSAAPAWTMRFHSTSMRSNVTALLRWSARARASMLKSLKLQDLLVRRLRRNNDS